MHVLHKFVVNLDYDEKFSSTLVDLTIVDFFTVNSSYLLTDLSYFSYVIIK